MFSYFSSFFSSNPCDKINYQILAQFVPNSSNLHLAHEYFDNITTDSEHKQYLLRTLKSIIIGEYDRSKALLLLGEGSNGKTILTRALLKILGFDNMKYCSHNFSTRHFDHRNTKVLHINEMDWNDLKNDVVSRDNFVKILDDKEIESRPLFTQNIIRYKPNFTLIGEANKIPKDLDNNIINKFNIINFSKRVNDSYFTKKMLDEHIDEIFTVIMMS